jgi:hypothetical protein
MKKVKMFLLLLAIVVSATQITAQTISSGGVTQVCLGSSVTLTASMLGAAQWYWTSTDVPLDPNWVTQNVTVTPRSAAVRYEVYFATAGGAIMNGGLPAYIDITTTAAPVVNVLSDLTNLCDASQANLTATATLLPNHTYQWEVSPDNAAWSTISDGGSYSGTATNQLTITVNPGLVGKYYHCVVVNTVTTCSSTTNASTIGALNAPPTATFGVIPCVNAGSVNSAIVTPAGGTAPYSIQVTSGMADLTAPNNVNPVGGVGAGGTATFSFSVNNTSYGVRVTDANGCYKDY